MCNEKRKPGYGEQLHCPHLTHKLERWLTRAGLLSVELMQMLAGFERRCAVQIVMTATTAVLCFVASPRTPQEHVAAQAVSPLVPCVPAFTLWCCLLLVILRPSTKVHLQPEAQVTLVYPAHDLPSPAVGVTPSV